MTGGGKMRTVGVKVDALVLIKIMKHCREHFPTPINGLLLGMDDENKVEITDCFGLQSKADLFMQLAKEKMDPKEIDEKIHLEDQRYQLKMLEQLHLVNIDCINVGWYQTMLFSDLRDPAVIEALCEHQEVFPNALVIGFDPQLEHLGAGAFKAFRVTEDVVACRREAMARDASAYNSLSGKNFLVEVPVVLRNSLLVKAFLLDWLTKDNALRRVGELDSLQFDDQAGIMERSIGFMTSCMDELLAEQEKTMRAQKDIVRAQQKEKEEGERRRIDNEQRRLRNEDVIQETKTAVKRPDVPSQLPSLLMANHVSRVAGTISKLTADNICRSLLVGQKEFKHRFSPRDLAQLHENIRSD